MLEQTDHWLVIDKPAGLVVHPPSPSAALRRSEASGEGQEGQATLTDWLRQNIPAIVQNFPPDDLRPGIVHRLDADTSGILLVAKDPQTLQLLQDQFRARTVEKIYHALVLGDPGKSGTLTGAIGRVGEDTRHAVKRLSFSWEKRTPKPAETDYRVIRQYRGSSTSEESFDFAHDTSEEIPPLTLLELRPKTGRTHQLRVQLLDHGTPIIGDQTYCTKESRRVSDELGLHRQFLHAVSLTFTDPTTRHPISVTSPLAPYLQSALAHLTSPV